MILGKKTALDFGTAVVTLLVTVCVGVVLGDDSVTAITSGSVTAGVAITAVGVLRHLSAVTSGRVTVNVALVVEYVRNLAGCVTAVAALIANVGVIVRSFSCKTALVALVITIIFEDVSCLSCSVTLITVGHSAGGAALRLSCAAC